MVWVVGAISCNEFCLAFHPTFAFAFARRARTLRREWYEDVFALIRAAPGK